MEDFLRRARLNELCQSCQTLGTICTQNGKDPETFGWQDAYSMAVALAYSQDRITQDDVKELHRRLFWLQTTPPPGVYRTEQVWLRDKLYCFPAPDEIADRMISWGEEVNAIPLSPAGAAEAHQSFVSIHPFFNGNGRVARLIMNTLLLRGGYHALFVTAAWKQEYNAALQSVQLGRDSRAFIDLIEKQVDKNEILFRNGR